MTKKFTYDGKSYFEQKQNFTPKSTSIVDFAINAEYFVESSGFYKEIELFNPKYYHNKGEFLYSLTLDFICMAFSKKSMTELFTIDDSYEYLFALTANEYYEHVHSNMDRYKNVEGIRFNHGYTNNRLGFFSTTILNNIQEKFSLRTFAFDNHIELFDYFSEHWDDNLLISTELIIAKQIVDSFIINKGNFQESIKSRFELNKETSKHIKSLIKLDV